MISQVLHDQINDQINKELFSEYQYLAMSIFFESVSLDGFAHFFRKQANEEREHADKFIEFLVDREVKAVLKDLREPINYFNTPMEAVQKALEHERFISKSIHELMDLARSENDHATQVFLNWFVSEQVEEEASMNKIIERLKFVENDGHGLLMLDKELGER